MKDIQSQLDHRRINIEKVGVKNISYPITVLDKSKKVQRTVAKVNMYVNLPHRFKGTHMSRFIEILNRFHGQIGFESFYRILEEMKEKLEAQAAHIEIEFPYFLKKNMDHVNAIIMGEYQCKMHGSLDTDYDLSLEIKVPILPPLPDQSNEGLPRSSGHWGFVHVRFRFRHFIWIEDLIQLIEEVISNTRVRQNSFNPDARPSVFSDVFPPAPSASRVAFFCLEHPLSVENITKALGEKLASHPDLRWFTITVENLAEGYSMFSSLEWPALLPQQANIHEL